jgi:hypothetical protein
MGAVIVALLILGWLGLQFQPRSFPRFDLATSDVARTPLPAGLPAPVERYYRSLYGDSVPVVDSVVITGRAKIRPVGPMWMPARYRFTHDAGKGYRHYIEVTWFGIRIMTVNERYVDGNSLMELPWATDEGPKVEQAANIGMWAELFSAAPSVLVTDPRVSWEPVDANTAALKVPLGERDTDRFVVRFDPESGLPTLLEAMRYRDSASTDKILWIAGNEWDEASTKSGCSAVGTATWLDMGKPWARFSPEETVINADVDSYLRSRGL